MAERGLAEAERWRASGARSQVGGRAGPSFAESENTDAGTGSGLTFCFRHSEASAELVLAVS